MGGGWWVVLMGGWWWLVMLFRCGDGCSDGFVEGGGWGDDRWW